MLLALLAVVPGWILLHGLTIPIGKHSIEIPALKTGFMPDMDEGAFVLDYNMPVGTSLSQTDKVLRRVEAVLRKTPDISGYIRRTGAELGFFATEPYTGDILVSLKPAGRRRPMDEIVDELREELESEVPELETEFVPLVQDQINDLAGVASPIEVKVFGPDFATLRTLAEQAGEIVEGVKGADDVNAHVYLGNPDVVVRPDSGQTARVGLTVMDVEAQLNAALYGQVASTVPEQDRMTKIRVRYPDPVRYDREHLAMLPISLATAAAPPAMTGLATAAGIGFVPLGQLATIRTVRSPNELWRENQQPVITVSAEQGERDLGSINREILEKMQTLKFPPGYRWELAGSYRAQQESFASLLTVLIVAAALVFLLMGFQFRSVILPIRLFLVQPISLVSALFALWITGTPLNVSSFMGAILLIGLDVKNEIILIEYIGQLREEGMPLHEALITAGRTRFRPILMTSLCTILGLVPLAHGHGTGRADATAAGDRRHRRPDHQHAPDPATDPGRIPRPRGTAGAGTVVSAEPWWAGGIMARILVVEDQEKHRDSLRRGLEAEGYDVVTASTGDDGFGAATARAVDAIVLDLMLPGRHGLDILRELRAGGFAKPVLILTALDAIEERVQGLDSGANDYLVKPFAFAELLARLRVLLRRDYGERELILRADDLEMDLLAHRVTRCGSSIDLTGREYELLEYLLRHKNEVVTRDMIARDVWKETTGAMTRIIDVYINALRKKVELPDRRALIHTVRGIGYALRDGS